MYMANADVDINLLLELQRLGFSIECVEDDCEVWVSSSGLSLQNDSLLRALEIVWQLTPNECGVQDGRLRLWWD